jgi:4-amino-4-deoxychorismate lyase
MPAAVLNLVNGVPDGVISAQDRGLTLGDGVFRTLRMEQGRPCWWADQYAKLEADCRQLGLSNPSRSEWEQDLAWIAVRLPDAVVRLTVTRGPGPRGYRLPDLPLPTRLCQATPLPDFPDPVAEGGARIRLCSLRLGHQPRLAGTKHLNRLENVLARAEWDDPDIDEGLLLDEAGSLVSGVMSNLFLWRGGGLLTPRLDRCGVAGVARGRLLHWAAGQGIPVRETDLALADLYAAEAAFLTNSLIRIRYVAAFGDRRWDRPRLYDTLQEALSCAD